MTDWKKSDLGLTTSFEREVLGILAASTVSLTPAEIASIAEHSQDRTSAALRSWESVGLAQRDGSGWRCVAPSNPRGGANDGRSVTCERCGDDRPCACDAYGDGFPDVTVLGPPEGGTKR